MSSWIKPSELPKKFHKEVRNTPRAAGYTIEELPDKTTRAVK